MKIVVGMSGGVDSSAAALVLRDAGFEVIGITLRLWPSGCVSRSEKACCGEKGIAAALETCGQLGIRHLIVDMQPEFRRRVVAYFCREYSRGRTPNPCVMCNPEVKFAALLDCAEELGAERIATGHYARVKTDKGRALLLRGVDDSKDQAYFLCRLTQPVLNRTVFPLGEYRKRQVRELAARSGLAVHNRSESQEICFIPGDDYRAFLREVLGHAFIPGDILDKSGVRIGTHQGIEFFTIGQRSGLQIQSRTRQYVLSMDPGKHTITVGRFDELDREETRVTDINWIAFEEPPGPFRAFVKIRHKHPGVMAGIRPLGNGAAMVKFDTPQKAVTPGQAAVFYDQDMGLGGGWID